MSTRSALRPERRGTAGSDAGSGLLSTTIGVFAFLMFLLLGVQVAYNLYATTMVTSAANDAARRLAGAARNGDPAGDAKAEAWVRELLGDYGARSLEQVDVRRDGGFVSLHVVARNPGFLPTSVRRPLGFDRIERTVRVRLELEV